METDLEQTATAGKAVGDARLWAVYCHLSLIMMGFHPALVLLPLVLWLAKRHQYPFVEEQGKEAVNFQITLTIILMILAIIVIGFLRILGHSVADLNEGLAFWYLLPLRISYLFIVVFAAWKVSGGTHFRYPLPFRLIK